MTEARVTGKGEEAIVGVAEEDGQDHRGLPDLIHVAEEERIRAPQDRTSCKEVVTQRIQGYSLEVSPYK